LGKDRQKRAGQERSNTRAQITPGREPSQSRHTVPAGVLNRYDGRDSHLLGLIEPEDIASMALYLASDDSRMITGQVLPVDSGVTIS
jgi:NAD(P)-dependent dehydrogenase (short-subunit alcohol dehydrogenase family)